jgi:outer membrane receptor for ferrienterochelin and colicins
MKNLYFLLLIILPVFAFSQTVTGTILDEKGKPLFGVNVIEKGTTNGTTTDFDGKFSLSLSSANARIVFKFLGYKDKEFSAAQSPFNFRMELDEIGLDQVVVSASKRKERLLDAPASVSIISAEKIENTAAMTPADNLKNIPGVDIMPTGLVSQNVVIRGFNNVFSQSMLTLVDHRIGSVPSLRLNAFQLMPGNNLDIEKIEIVRGPGSALYGPNAADGVMHIITKSPMSLSDEQNAETSVSITGGWQSVINPEFRHAHKVSDKFGYKISGGYMQGQDFKYYDPREPNFGDEFWFGTVVDGTRFEIDSARGLQSFDRNFFIQKYNMDSRFDFAFTEDIDLTLNAGFASSNNLELTGLGAAQTDGWLYSFAQARFRWKNLFVNTFMNSSNSNDTYIISQVAAGSTPPYRFQTLADKSKMYALQIQNSNYIDDKWSFTYGFDGLFTRPNSGGTIYGRYEDDSDINQVGGYLQTEWDVNEKIKLLAAIRGDYQTPIKEFQVSPRGGIVYKPNLRHTMRATYNRAFNTPSALNLAIDLPQLFIPNGITARGLGNPTGFNYRYGVNGLPEFRSPYAITNQGWFQVGDISQNHTHFEGIARLIARGIAAESIRQSGQPVTEDGLNVLGSVIFDEIFDNPNGTSLVDPNSPINNVEQVVRDFITGNEIDLATIKDRKPVGSVITQTYEIGYKGVIKDKLFLSTDFYYTRISDFISPLTPMSYRVQFNEEQLANAISAIMQENIFISNIVPDENAERIIASTIANANGLSLGTVAPESDLINSDLVLSYANFGQVDVFGIDVGATYLVTDNISVSGAFSWVNRDRFDVEGASNGFIALNAPRYKSSVAVDWMNIADTGFGFGVNWRWQDAFPANSALYVGEVKAANLIDVNVSYRPRFSENTILSANFYNIANYQFQRFPGTPAIGFYGLFKLQHTFGYKIGKSKGVQDIR